MPALYYVQLWWQNYVVEPVVPVDPVLPVLPVVPVVPVAPVLPTPPELALQSETQRELGCL